MRLEVLTTLAQVRDLKPQWDALLETALDPSPFVQPEWLIPWWDAFSESDWEMRFAAVWSGDELRCIAPLYESFEKSWGRRRRVIRFWANVWSNRVNLVVSTVEPDASVAALADGLWPPGAGGALAVLGMVALDSATTQTLLRALGERDVRYGIDEGYSSPYMAVPASWDDLLERLSPSFRATLRRKHRRAEREGAVFEMIRGAQGLSEAFAVSAETWQHATGTGIVSTPQLRGFYGDVAEGFAGRGQLQIALLRLRHQPIAFELNLVRDRTLYNLKVGYRQLDRALSPGVVLRRHVIADAISSGYAELDFLGDTERYKSEWAGSARRHGRIVAFPRGVVPGLWHTVRYRLRSLVRRSAEGERSRRRPDPPL